MPKAAKAKFKIEGQTIVSGDCRQAIHWYTNWLVQQNNSGQISAPGLFATNFESDDQLLLDTALANLEGHGIVPFSISGEELYKQADYLWQLALQEAKFGQTIASKIETEIKNSPLLLISNLQAPATATQLWYLYHYVLYPRALAEKPMLITTPLSYEEFVVFGAGCDDFEYAGRRLAWEKIVSVLNATVMNLSHAKQLQAENVAIMLQPEYRLYRGLQSRHLSVMPQHKVGKENHTLDFALVDQTAKINLNIECDHGLITEKQRDRDTALLKEGWKILRLSFKEIMGNLDSCVDAIEELVKNGVKKSSVGRYSKDPVLVGKFNLAVEDKDQYKAIMHPGGPAAIVGGAGTGKSTCVAERIAYLVSRGVSPERILLLSHSPETIKLIKTASSKSVSPQLLDKVNFYIWQDFGMRILKENVSAIKRKLPLKVENATLKILQKLIAKYKKEQDATALELSGDIDENAAASVIALYKANLLSAQMMKEQAKTGVEQLLAKVYLAYEDQLQKANKIDKEDMISLAAQLLGQEVDLRTQYQNLFEHIIVDEYQDVSIACDFLARLLAFPNDNLILVGNEDEAIFEKSGSAPRLLSEIAIRLPNAHYYMLGHNWRAHPQITKHAEQFVSSTLASQKSKHRIEKTTLPGWGEVPSQAIVGPYEFSDQISEANWIAEQIELIMAAGRKHEEIAVISRAKENMVKLEEIFSQKGLIVSTTSPDISLLPDESADVLSFLKLVADPDGPKAREYFERVCQLRAKTVPPKLSATIAGCAESFNLSYLKAVEIYSEAAADPFCLELEQLVKIIRAMHQDKTPPAKVISLLKRPQWFGEYYTSIKVPPQANYEPLKVMTQMEEDAHTYKTTADFLKNYSPARILDHVADLSGSAINLLSIAEAKGREFPIVFISGLSDGIFPDKSQQNQEEEKRIFYVAMTRARELLYLSFAKTIDGQVNNPSPFLTEAGLNTILYPSLAQTTKPEIAPAEIGMPPVESGDLPLAESETKYEVQLPAEVPPTVEAKIEEIPLEKIEDVLLVEIKEEHKIEIAQPVIEPPVPAQPPEPPIPPVVETPVAKATEPLPSETVTTSPPETVVDEVISAPTEIIEEFTVEPTENKTSIFDQLVLKARQAKEQETKEVVENIQTPPVMKGAKCNNCNAPLEAGAHFCGECGAPQVVPPISQPSAAKQLCLSCGTPLEPGAKFCGECGSSQQ